MIPIQLHDLMIKDISVFEDRQSINTRVIDYAVIDGGFSLPKRGRRTTKKIQISGTVSNTDCDSCRLTVKQYKVALERMRSFGVIDLYAYDPIDDEVYKIKVVASDPYFITYYTSNFDFSLSLESVDQEWVKIDKNLIFRKQSNQLCSNVNWLKTSLPTDISELCYPIVDVLDPFWSPPPLAIEANRIRSVQSRITSPTLTNFTATTTCGAGSYTTNTATATSSIIFASLDCSKYVVEDTKVTNLDYLSLELSFSSLTNLIDCSLKLNSTGIGTNTLEFLNIQKELAFVSGQCATLRLPITNGIFTGNFDFGSINQIILNKTTTSTGSSVSINNLRFEKIFGVNKTGFSGNIGLQSESNADIQVFAAFRVFSPKTIQYGSETFQLSNGCRAMAIYDSKVEILLPNYRQVVKRIKTKHENGQSVGISIISQDLTQAYYNINKTQI